MNKGRFIKTVVATLCLTSMMSIVAFAEKESRDELKGYGEAYLYQDYTGGLGMAYASTTPKIKKNQTLTLLNAYYDDGDVGQRREGPEKGVTSTKYDYGYIESFSSNHRVIENALLRAQTELH